MADNIIKVYNSGYSEIIKEYSIYNSLRQSFNYYITKKPPIRGGS